MSSHEDIKRKIDTATELHSLVRTMKAMAAVNIRQLEKAADSLVDFQQTIDLGIQALARQASHVIFDESNQKNGNILILVFGSDQGMCGTMNEHLAKTVVQEASQLERGAGYGVEYVAIGERVAGKLAELDVGVSRVLSVPNSIPGTTPLVHELLILLDESQTRKDVNQVFVTYCQRKSKTDFELKFERIFPVDPQWFNNRAAKIWPTNQLPMVALSARKLFSGLFQQFLFISMFNACVDSQVCENSNRLIAMQRAEKNIESQLDVLNGKYHQQRQMAITEELLDIASGFEAINSKNQ